MMTNDLYQALQQCIRLARSGVPMEECLAQYPEYASELKPLLMAANTPPAQGRVAQPCDPTRMSVAAKSRVRQRVMEHWDLKHSRRKGWSFLVGSHSRAILPLRWAAATAVAVFLILI